MRELLDWVLCFLRLHHWHQTNRVVERTVRSLWCRRDTDIWVEELCCRCRDSRWRRYDLDR